MLNTKHLGYEPTGAYQCKMLFFYQRGKYKEVKLLILATFSITYHFFQQKLASLICEVYKKKVFDTISNYFAAFKFI